MEAVCYIWNYYATFGSGSSYKNRVRQKPGLSYSLCAYVHSAMYTPNHHIVSIARLYGFFLRIFSYVTCWADFGSIFETFAFFKIVPLVEKRQKRRYSNHNDANGLKTHNSWGINPWASLSTHKKADLKFPFIGGALLC